MSDRMFPALPGVVFASREPFFDNAVQESQNGRRLVVRKRMDAGYRYVLDVKFLRIDNGEARTMFSFFEDHGGVYESFLYTDPLILAVKRVHFHDDDLLLRKERGPYYTGEITLETVVED